MCRKAIYITDPVSNQVTPGSLAAKCGLQVGDTIVKIGDTATDTLRHKEAQSAVIASGNSLELSLRRYFLFLYMLFVCLFIDLLSNVMYSTKYSKPNMYLYSVYVLFNQYQ